MTTAPYPIDSNVSSDFARLMLFSHRLRDLQTSRLLVRYDHPAVQKGLVELIVSWGVFVEGSMDGDMYLPKLAVIDRG
jgi:hypothetical protein